MKEKISKIWNQFKNWFLSKALPWLKKNWMQIVNFLIVFIAYDSLDDKVGAQTVVGLWLFILMAYYIFWKLFGLEKLFLPNKTLLEDVKLVVYEVEKEVKDDVLKVENKVKEVVKEVKDEVTTLETKAKTIIKKKVATAKSEVKAEIKDDVKVDIKIDTVDPSKG
jgi:hypothetical protein